MKHVLNLSRGLGLGGIITLLLVTAAPAQQPEHARGVQNRVAVALVDELPELGEQFDAVILRRAKAAPRDIILLSSGSGMTEAYDSAIRTLLFERLLNGAEPTTHRGKPFETMTIGVRASDAPAEWAERHMDGAKMVIDALLEAPERTIPGVGRYQAVMVRPPRPMTATRGGR